MKNEVNNQGMSLSKQRKLERMAEIAKQKKQKTIRKVVLVLAIVVILGIIALIIRNKQIEKENEPSSTIEFSAMLDNDGKIQNVKPLDYISLPDYSTIKASLADVEFSDEDVDAAIEDEMSGKTDLVDSPEAVAALGDTVSIDFSGSVDGEVFENGTSEDYELELGSGSFIDDFEDQIVGHKPGDEFDVEVTFPDPYENNADLAGKDAVFAVKLNGIYVPAEINDEYVQENLSEYASNVEEYRQYLKDTNYEKNLKSFAEQYIIDNTTLNKTPKDFQKQLEKNQRNTDYYNYEYMNNLYASFGSAGYDSFDTFIQEMYSKSMDEYNDSLDEMIESEMKFRLACQAIAEAEGINASLDAAREQAYAEGTTEDDFASQLEYYGTGYVVQNYMCQQVVELLSKRVHVE